MGKELDIILISLLFFFISGSENIKSAERPSASLNITYKVAKQIVENKYECEPDTVFISNLSLKRAIIAVINPEPLREKLIILTEFANNWQEEICIDLLDLPKIEDAEIVKLGNVEYVYYCATGCTKGGCFADFNLVSIPKMEEYSIDFLGENIGEYDEMSQIDPNLKNNKKLLGYLEKKVTLSKIFHKKSAAELDINYFKNYKKKWRIKNSHIYSLLTSIKGTCEIVFPHYTADLFNTVKHGDIWDKIENSKYIIISFYKDNIIGYDKIKKSYFVIWVPEDPYSWLPNVKFVSDNIIKMFESEDDPYIVDLEKNTISHEN
ncbi:MAG: hypothetical protein HF312_02690 [Ignavibacteria bacterium]|nr:hypothetical protein [Ignavibacteria bacterium]MCU7519093.1 hypothetical protein [Ignavibacteria bacterium]